MRAFTAIFYLLFFSLTAWGQTGTARGSNVVGQLENVANMISAKGNGAVEFNLYSAVAASLSTSTHFNLNCGSTATSR